MAEELNESRPTGAPQIVFVWSTHPGQGAPHQVMAALWLVRAGFKVLCVAEGPAETGIVSFPIGNLPTRLIPRGSGRWQQGLWHVKLLLHLLLGRFGPYRKSLFYVQGHTVPAAVTVALAGIARHRVLYHTQDFLEPGRHKFWEFFERHLARRAGAVIVNEPNRGRFMASYYKLRRTPKVVRTALPLAWPWPRYDQARRDSMLARLGFAGSPEDARLLVHYGPLTATRCGAQIASALKLLPRNYFLVVTGVQSLEHGPTAEHLRGAGVQDRVVTHPAVSYADLQEIGAACDIGLLLYPDDGVGNFYQAPGRLSEYLRAGLAILAPAYPSMELLNLQLGFGASCEPMDPQSIASAVRTLGERPGSERAFQRESNLRCAQEILCYEVEAPKLLNVVQQVVNGLDQ